MNYKIIFYLVLVSICNACDLEKNHERTIYVSFDSSLGSLQTNIPVYHNEVLIGNVIDVSFENEKFIAEIRLNEGIIILNKTNFYVTEPDFYGNYEIKADLSFADMIVSKSDRFEGYILQSDTGMIKTLDAAALDTTKNPLFMRIDSLMKANQ
tara:strand:+ start:676 stop:1134 length:459 start_codon:yes stop_codon:yes gene_type:complete